MSAPTAEQLRAAERNTAQEPRNQSPAVRRAMENTKRPPVTPGYLDALRRLMQGAQ